MTWTHADLLRNTTVLEATRPRAAHRCVHCRNGRTIYVEMPGPHRGWIYHAADDDWTDTDCTAEEIYRMALLRQLEQEAAA